MCQGLKPTNKSQLCKVAEYLRFCIKLLLRYSLPGYFCMVFTTFFMKYILCYIAECYFVLYDLAKANKCFAYDGLKT